jgi:hypothetical protein
MHRHRCALVLGAACLFAGTAGAHAPVVVEIVGRDGATFREIPLDSRDDALRSYLQAEKGARYEVRVRNTTGERLGLVIAVDGRNIIDGSKSELARNEPMYVLGAWETQGYAGWRASLEAINEFYFTDWQDSYAEAFGDRSARGVIAVAVFREVPPHQPYRERQRGRADADAQPLPPPAAAESGRGAGARSSRDESAGTGYGDRRIDQAVRVEFVAQSSPDSRHFIKYEWRETLCRRQLLDCGQANRFWDDSVVGFAPPPPRY